jgi:isoleucyl-tRNA synthetase
VFNQVPYRSVLALGHLVDPDGRKMSKSLGNAVDPWDVLATRGADPLRWWMFHQGSPWSSTRTSLAAIDDSTADVLMTLWHTWSFFSTYARLNGFDPADPAIPAPERRGPLDRWARSRLHATITEVTQALEDYQPLEAATAIAGLVDDLSNWYVRRSRRRFWRTDTGADPADSLAAQATLHEALVTIALLLAPFCPFVAEHLWSQLTDAAESASVHLADWPASDPAAHDAGLEEEMELARRLVSIGRSARSRAGLKVRQPLRRAVVALPPNSPRLLVDIIAEELNVDEVVLADTLGEVLSFELIPNFRLLGPRLGASVKEVAPALTAIDSQAAAAELEQGSSIQLDLSTGPVHLGADDIEIRVRARQGFAVSRQGTEAVALDTELDDSLRRRGLLRDVVRQVQELRRALGLAVSDRINLTLSGLDELSQQAGELGRDVLASKVTFGSGAGEGTLLETDDNRRAQAWIQAV